MLEPASPLTGANVYPRPTFYLRKPKFGKIFIWGLRSLLILKKKCQRYSEDERIHKLLEGWARYRFLHLTLTWVEVPSLRWYRFVKQLQASADYWPSRHVTCMHWQAPVLKVVSLLLFLRIYGRIISSELFSYLLFYNTVSKYIDFW